MRITALAFTLLCASAHADTTSVRLNYADHSLVVSGCNITENDPYVLSGNVCASSSVIAPAAGLNLAEPTTHVTLSSLFDGDPYTVVDDQCQYVAFIQAYNSTGGWSRDWEFQCGDFVFFSGFEP